MKILKVFGLFLLVLLLGSGLYRSMVAHAETDVHRPNYSAPLFPSGSYSLKVGANTVTTNYSYSVPVPLFADNNTRFEGPIEHDFDPQLGQFHKGIYFFPIVSPGPAGMFDITDPMHPKPSNLTEWTFGGSYSMHGPLNAFNWSHDAQYHGSDVAEDQGGSARLWSFLGSPSYSKVITQFDGGSGSIGGMIDDSEDGKFRWTSAYGLFDPTRAWTDANGGTITAMISPKEGKFFLYSAGGWNGQNGYLPVSLFDASDLPGSVNPPRYVNDVNQSAPNLKASASLGWTNVNELQVIPSPDKSKYFLFGRVPGATPNPSCADGSTPGYNGVCPFVTYIYHPESAPTIHIGEINADTGKLVRQKTVTITDIKQKEYPARVNSLLYYPPVSNMQWAIVNGVTYVFAIDDMPFDANEQFPYVKSLVIGIYKFDPVNLTLTRKSQVTIPNVTGEPYAAELPVVNPHKYTVIGSEDGSAYPILAVPNNPGRSGVASARYLSDSAELQFFGTKKFFSATSTTASSPDFVFKAKGQHAKAGEEILNVVPYLGFLRTESGKVNLYLFRNAFQATLDASPANQGSIGNANADIPNYDVRYGGGIRTDKIDVTSLNNASTNSTSPASAGGKLQFVKALFNNDPAPQGAGALGDVMVWGKNGDKFVIAGEYGGSLSGGTNGQVTAPLDTVASKPGGGLWTVQEDGSKIIEREAALDAGAGSNVLYFHGHGHHYGVLHYEWGNGGFVKENSSTGGSCVGGSIDGFACSGGTGPGANRAVYYKAGSDGFPVPAGKSSAGDEYSVGIVALKGRIIQGNIQLGTNAPSRQYTLPGWQDLGGVDASVKSSSGLGFGDYIVAGGKLYSLDQDGNSNELMSLLDGGYSNYVTAFDNSAYPPKLALMEYHIGTSSSIPIDAKIKVYKLTSTGAALDKNLPGPGISTYPAQFAIWGNYVVLPGKAGASNGNSLAGSLEVWKDGQKTDSVFLPAGGNPSYGGLAISKSGYVAVVPIAGSGSRETLAYLYKLNTTGSTATAPTTPVIIPPGGINPVTPIAIPPAPSTTDQCIEKYRNLCDQIKTLQEQLCKLTPTLAFCKP
jgi:hypothetical protein